MSMSTVICEVVEQEQACGTMFRGSVVESCLTTQMMMLCMGYDVI